MDQILIIVKKPFFFVSLSGKTLDPAIEKAIFIKNIPTQFPKNVNPTSVEFNSEVVKNIGTAFVII